MEAMSASVHYHSSPPSQTSLAPSGTTHTQSASVSTSNPHLDHLAPGSSKVSRSGSLSLIGSARVRLAKDVSVFLHALLKPIRPCLTRVACLFSLPVPCSYSDPHRQQLSRPSVPPNTANKGVPMYSEYKEGHADNHAQREPSDAQELALLPSHAQYLSGEPSESDIESMENANEERRDRRGFGARVSPVIQASCGSPCAEDTRD